MLELSFTATDLAHTRFAISPMWEVVASVRVLQRPEEHPLLRRWSDYAAPSLKAARVDWPLLASLVPVPTRLIPGFVCPPPTTPVPDLDVELATLRATPPEVVKAHVASLPGPIPPLTAELAERPEKGLATLAEEIAQYWDVALAPHWPRIRSALEADVLYRARRLIEGGTALLFEDLDPQITWEDAGSLRLAHRHVIGKRPLRGRGLLLVPSAFIWPRIFSSAVPGRQPTLRYPPRGIGNLWSPERFSVDAAAALAGVLGEARALLLTELSTPATTTELAHRTGMSPSGVSQHLRLLRDAGLVDRHHRGRKVLYTRTRRSQSLLSG